MGANDWLYRLFNSTCFTDWIALYYLNIYRTPGLQYYLLQKLDPANISKLMPQLCHILFSSNSPVILHYLLTHIDGNPSLCLKLWFCVRVYGTSKGLARLLRNWIKQALLKHRHRAAGASKLRIYAQRGMPETVQGVLIRIFSAAAFYDRDVYGYASSFRGCHVHGQPEDPDISFADELVGVSERLRVVDRPLRRKALQIEIARLNRLIRKVSNIPLVEFGGEGLMIDAGRCRLLDSASNAPYMVAVRRWDGVQPAEASEIEIMWMQLYAVEPSADVEKIRERLIREFWKKVKEENEKDGNQKAREEKIELLVPYKPYNDFYLKVIHNQNNLEENGVIQNGLVGNESPQITENSEELIGGMANEKSIGNKPKAEITSKSNNHQTEDREISIDPSDKGNKSKAEITSKSNNDPIEDRQISIDPIDTGELERLTEMIENLEINKNGEEENKFPDQLIIVKSGNDMRLEFIAYQVLSEIQAIWDEHKCHARVRPYQIYLTSPSSGFIEVVRDAPSIHEIKKTHGTLRSYYAHKFGAPDTPGFARARENFLHSLVGYSIATYLLQLKDRHNGNILIDAAGCVVHVDFGFVFGRHPGIYNVEFAPFKFATEYLDLVAIPEFKALFVEAFMVLRKCSERLCRLVEIFGSNSDVFAANAVPSFRQRFRHDLGQIELFVEGLVDRSVGAVTTRLYDSFQYYSQGYFQ